MRSNPFKKKDECKESCAIAHFKWTHYEIKGQETQWGFEWANLRSKDGIWSLKKEPKSQLSPINEIRVSVLEARLGID